MRSMFGIRYNALSGLWICWLCHFIGPHPMLRYTALSGLHLISPERAIYNSEAESPLASEWESPLASEWESPLASHYSEWESPLARYNSGAEFPLAIKMEKL
jgi:hypothetical protein